MYTKTICFSLRVPMFHTIQTPSTKCRGVGTADVYYLSNRRSMPRIEIAELHQSEEQSVLGKHQLFPS